MGTGVPQDDAQAFAWFKKAADQGLALAQTNIAKMINEGKATEILQKSAQQGDKEAQFQLGVMYENGQGVLKDPAKAVSWYQKAAAQNHALAQNNLGWAYFQGLGIARDDAQALKWFQTALSQGVEIAQNNIDLMIQQGRVPSQKPSIEEPQPDGQPSSIEDFYSGGLTPPINEYAIN